MVHHGMTHLIVTAQKRHLAVLIPSSASAAVRAVPDSQQSAGEILFCRLVLTLLILLALNYSRNIYKIEMAEEVDFN